MRGLLSLFTKAGDLGSYRTGIFIASAEPDVLARALPALKKRFPQVSFSVLLSRAYAEQSHWIGEAFVGQEVLWIEQLKINPTRWFMRLRKRRFDLCVILWSGRPTFRTTKVAAFLLRTRRVVVYDEKGHSFVLDRKRWKYILVRASSRLRKGPSEVLFVPVGFVYLLLRTLWLVARGRFAGKVESQRGVQVRIT
jgi:hypothetical protein